MPIPASLSKLKSLFPVFVVGASVAITIKLLTESTPLTSNLLQVKAEEDIFSPEYQEILEDPKEPESEPEPQQEPEAQPKQEEEDDKDKQKEQSPEESDQQDSSSDQKEEKNDAQKNEKKDEKQPSGGRMFGNSSTAQLLKKILGGGGQKK